MKWIVIGLLCFIAVLLLMLVGSLGLVYAVGNIEGLDAYQLALQAMVGVAQSSMESITDINSQTLIHIISLFRAAVD